MTNNKQSIYALLRKRYPEKEYALMQEVRDKAGFAASRSGDFIAVNLWPSRGLAINGIELKSFRGDWLSELKKPEKAENIFQYCDRDRVLANSATSRRKIGTTRLSGCPRHQYLINYATRRFFLNYDFQTFKY